MSAGRTMSLERKIVQQNINPVSNPILFINSFYHVVHNPTLCHMECNLRKTKLQHFGPKLYLVNEATTEQHKECLNFLFRVSKYEWKALGITELELSTW